MATDAASSGAGSSEDILPAEDVLSAEAGSPLEPQGETEAERERPAAGCPSPDFPSSGRDAAVRKFDAGRLIREHQAGVWRYLRVLGCSPSEAEDLTQDTFLAVLQKPFQEINRAATAAYLRQAARNLFISSQRRAARSASTAELDELEQTWTRWAASDDGEELLAALQKCLGALAGRARRALDMRFREGRSRAEIAAMLSLSEDGAKNLMQRAKQHLRTCIERSLRC